ncbi:hypothetical protein SHI21_12800 [Bacteriovorax sp. PP10]|uniref:Lipoprotein n=1 Tax=Bacteriovorax antarcticus TaxID=3088717 RepID=A0ABU5VVM5_9BACT|nr:hypothetical protein [Bacteriovorax sp. PP10]MEA9357096.1 hypothetical protein [Bacteriovorax sp. PP10]
MSFRSIKSTFLIAVLMLSFSCGKSKEQEVKDAILSANIYLSTRQCQPAIDLLESMGRQNTNALYLKTLSTGYACRAGYSTTSFFADDISKTATPSPLGGMTTYKTSLVTTTSPLTDDSSFRDLQTAIDILLYAGGIAETTDPSASERAKHFSFNQAGDINSQLAFMMLVQTGKLMKVYADTNAAGVKGGGSGSNTCFTDYTTTDPLVKAYLLTGNTGVCVTDNSSNTQLALGVSDRRKRLCEGTVLLNNILDILPSVIATAGGGKLDDITTITTQINAKKAALEGIDPDFTPTATVLSQTNCENDSDIDEITLSSYYAVFFESLVK